MKSTPPTPVTARRMSAKGRSLRKTSCERPSDAAFRSRYVAVTGAVGADVKSSRVKSSQVESSQVKSSRVKSSRVESSQVESSRVESSRVKSSQVESSRVKASQGMQRSTKREMLYKRTGMGSKIGVIPVLNLPPFLGWASLNSKKALCGVGNVSSSITESFNMNAIHVEKSVGLDPLLLFSFLSLFWVGIALGR